MKNFSKGVSYYTKAVVEISFPEEQVCCELCPMMGVEMASSRKYCRKTGEYLTATRDIVGFYCPLCFANEGE